MLKGSDGFLQSYNTQIAVEPVFQLIVGQRVTQAANGKQQMLPLVEAIEEQSGQKPEGVLADNGYCSNENLKYLARKRMEGFVATGKQKPVNGESPASEGRYREKPAGSSAWNESWKPRLGRRYMRPANSSWSRSSGRSNRHAIGHWSGPKKRWKHSAFRGSNCRSESVPLCHLIKNEPGERPSNAKSRTRS
jgi:hypothetical protein